ncbi:coagulation factor 5/8 type domain-containing protein [Streptomyces tateyamensis]|uniref:Coagulation factor 5/8 type domain-containing protein n=1 Tax=Streptomyces tateyamensis TaxID=565073 RepID=A0A2V4MUK9_9ACTN|nr:ricin-type beta-trefoil lectin domain protein [Streptomyces tateyamensis]PYC69065.1 coagulation factor 5/8 type domain-containing protein [Streptomyces tateyamensis]
MPQPQRGRPWRLATTVALLQLAAGLAALAPAANAAAAPAGSTEVAAAGATGQVVGYGGLCLDDRSASSANFNPVQVYTCNGTNAQQWTVGSDSTLRVLGKCLDVNGGGTADGTAVDLYDCNGTGAQVWQPQANGTLLNPQSGKCLDDTGWSTTPGTQSQIWTCSTNANQQWTLPSAPAASPFGPNVLVFDPSQSSAAIQSRLDQVYSQQQSNQFGASRYAVLFKPGSYNVNVNVGFYTQVLGLGQSPDDTTITGGLNADAQWNGGNATENFWRGAENLSVAPTSGTTKWAVSQAAPLRRVHLRGNLVLDDNGGWSSGGFLGNAKVDGQTNSGSQQQWLSRNDEFGSWTGANWNMVFVGDSGAPGQSFPNPPYTTLGQTPTSVEKPYLTVDAAGGYSVFVPSSRTNSQGTDWSSGRTSAGSSLPLSSFYVATPSDSAAGLNAALAAGKNLLFTPGVYQLSDTLRITRPDTVVLGLGLATLVANNGVTAISTADVDGVRIAGLIVDAGTTNSPTLVQIGPAGASAGHAADPTVLSDVFFRVGGAAVGKASQTLQVNANNTIGDDLWLWRADHGSGVGWTSNTAATGLVVNGANVTMYGLAVEHYQQYQVRWNGNGGRTYFYQSELPYDPPSQASWMNGSSNGWASYQVAPGVTDHQAWGLGVYCYFSANPSTVADRAIEVPNTPGVSLHDSMDVSLGGTGTITHIVNSTGAAVRRGSTVADLTSYP